MDKEDETQDVKQGQLPPQIMPQASNYQKLPVTPVTNPGQTNLLNKYKQQQTVSPQGESNLINQYKDAPKPEPQAPLRTYIPSPEGYKEPKPVEPVRSYVPSPVGVQVAKTQEDPTAANLAMQKAEAAERAAMEILKMN